MEISEMRDKLAAMYKELYELSKELNSRAYETRQHEVAVAWVARAWSKVESAAEAVQRAQTAVEVGFDLILKEREPS